MLLKQLFTAGQRKAARDFKPYLESDQLPASDDSGNIDSIIPEQVVQTAPLQTKLNEIQSVAHPDENISHLNRTRSKIIDDCPVGDTTFNRN